MPGHVSVLAAWPGGSVGKQGEKDLSGGDRLLRRLQQLGCASEAGMCLLQLPRCGEERLLEPAGNACGVCWAVGQLMHGSSVD